MVKVDVLREIKSKVKGVNYADIEVILTAYSEVVKETLLKDKDEKVPLPGIGSFSVKHINEKNGFMNGKEWHKDAEDQLTFKINKSVKTL